MPRAQAATDEASEPRPGILAERLFVRAPVGPLRLAHGQLAAQVSWLLPLAAMALVLGAWQGAFRKPLAPAGQSLLFWACWIGTYVIVYSYAGGIIHYYYLATLAPALAALAGIGLVGLWNVHTSALGWSLMETRAPADDWRTWLLVALVIGTIAEVAALVAFRKLNRIAIEPAAGALFVGVAALLVMPVAWALSSVLVAGHGVLPSADLYRLDPAVLRREDPRVRGTFGRLMDTSRLVAFLEANRSGERFLLATTTTRLAAPIIISTGEAVMAMGGFHGLDSAMTPEKLAQRVEARELRFVMLGDAAAPSRRMGADAALEPLTRWVREHGQRVAGERWRSATNPRGMVLYDLRPKAGLR